MALRHSSMPTTCSGLLAGSRYNVSVSAISSEGEGPSASTLLWTEVGTPRTPDPPTLVRRDGGPAQDGTIRVVLHPVEQLEGPITAYQVRTSTEINAEVYMYIIKFPPPRKNIGQCHLAGNI
jgi:hypothetical protein